jgi:hypothetical protein
MRLNYQGRIQDDQAACAYTRRSHTASSVQADVRSLSCSPPPDSFGMTTMNVIGIAISSMHIERAHHHERGYFLTFISVGGVTILPQNRGNT